MKTIKFEDQKVNVPTQWNEVSLGNYEKWYAHKQKNEGYTAQAMASLCNVDAQWIQKLPKATANLINETVQFLADPNFEPSQTIEINKELYTLASSENLTLGEWVDVDSIFNGESETLFSDILAVVCRPVGEFYSHENSTERAELFRKQSCEKMLPLVSFFLRKGHESKVILNHYSQVKEAATQYLRDIKNFVANGDGIKRLPIWQQTRYSYLIRSLEKQLSRFSDSYFIE